MTGTGSLLSRVPAETLCIDLDTPARPAQVTKLLTSPSASIDSLALQPLQFYPEARARCPALSTSHTLCNGLASDG
jgi:hypothetical protein